MYELNIGEEELYVDLISIFYVFEFNQFKGVICQVILGRYSSY